MTVWLARATYQRVWLCKMQNSRGQFILVHGSLPYRLGAAPARWIPSFPLHLSWESGLMLVFWSTIWKCAGRLQTSLLWRWFSWNLDTGKKYWWRPFTLVECLAVVCTLMRCKPHFLTCLQSFSLSYFIYLGPLLCSSWKLVGFQGTYDFNHWA